MANLRENSLVEHLFGGTSMPIIDEIDSVLMKHHGFADGEFDLIINYDIKYRMGRKSGEGDGDDG